MLVRPPAANARPGRGSEASVRRVQLLVAATIGYNIVEAVVALTAGATASSSALLGFGLDSVLEVSSAAAVAWQHSAREHTVREAREHTALRITSLAFFALAAVVSVDSVRGLMRAERPAHSAVGLALAGLSLVIMPVLSLAQRQAGRRLNSASAVADSKQTLLCTYLSAVLLLGLLANLALGWWWADPAAGLIISVVAVREGINAAQGDVCCVPMISAADLPNGGHTHSGCACCS